MLTSLLAILKSKKIYNYMAQIYKQNKTVCLTLLGFVFWLLLFIGFPSLISDDKGNQFIQGLLKKLPFINVSQKIADFKDAPPDIGVLATSVDFFKVLLSSMIKGILFSVIMSAVTILFGITKISDKITSRSAWIDAMEERLDSVSYKFWEGSVTFCVTLVSQVLIGSIVGFLEGQLALLVNLQGVAVSAIIFITFFLIYSLFFAWKEQRTLEVGILKTYLVNIFPEILSIFIFNILCFSIYISYIRDGLSLRYFLLFLLMVVWSGVESNIKKAFVRLFVFLTGSKKISNISLISAFFWFVTVLFMMLAIYIMLIVMSAAPQKGLWLYMPLLQGALKGMSLESALLNEQADIGLTLIRLLSVILIVALMLKQNLIKNSVLWFFVWPFAIIFVSIYAETELNYLFFKYEKPVTIIILIIIFFFLAYDFYLVLVSAGATICLLFIYRELPKVSITITQEDQMATAMATTPFACWILALIILATVTHYFQTKT